MKRRPGRPPKGEDKLVVKKNVSISRENYDYILRIIQERQWVVSGKFSTVLNELVLDHLKVKKYKDREAGKLKEKLEGLD